MEEVLIAESKSMKSWIHRTKETPTARGHPPVHSFTDFFNFNHSLASSNISQHLLIVNLN